MVIGWGIVLIERGGEERVVPVSDCFFHECSFSLHVSTIRDDVEEGR